MKQESRLRAADESVFICVQGERKTMTRLDGKHKTSEGKFVCQ